MPTDGSRNWILRFPRIRLSLRGDTEYAILGKVRRSTTMTGLFWTLAKVYRVSVLTVLLACNGASGKLASKSIDRESVKPQGKATNSWPAEGVCAISTYAKGGRCRILQPQDGERIRAALRTHLRSEAATQKHAKQDLETATHSLGPPHLVRRGQTVSPAIGGYFIYLDEATQTLRIENTVAMTDTGRWGFSFRVQEEKGSWIVTSFNHWKAWRR